MKKTLKVLVAAGLSLGVTSVAYAAVQQCEAPIPDTIRCRNANSTLQAKPNAFDSSPTHNGSQFTHSVSFEAGTSAAFGNVLDSSGHIVCPRASDSTLDGNPGAAKICTPPAPLVGAKYRVSIS